MTSPHPNQPIPDVLKFNTDINEMVPPPHSWLEKKQKSTVQNITDLFSTDFAKKKKNIDKTCQNALEAFFSCQKDFKQTKQKKSQTQNINKKNHISEK
jgi:ABC-type Zn uptake system ZnuABC Zn-binding protein ZnuA